MAVVCDEARRVCVGQRPACFDGITCNFADGLPGACAGAGGARFERIGRIIARARGWTAAAQTATASCHGRRARSLLHRAARGFARADRLALHGQGDDCIVALQPVIGAAHAGVVDVGRSIRRCMPVGLCTPKRR